MAFASIDFGILEELQAVCDTATVRELIAMFLSEAPQRLAEAGEAFAEADYARMQATMHRLRSSAGNLGAHRLQAQAARLELLEQPEQHVDDIRQMLQSLAMEYRGVVQSLNQFQKGLPTL